MKYCKYLFFYRYWVFHAEGRIGEKSTHKTIPFEKDLAGAKKMFHEKFQEKTGNAFGYETVKKFKMYFALDVDEPKSLPSSFIQTTLDDQVYSLMENFMEFEQISEIAVTCEDVNMALGPIGISQLDNASKVLMNISVCIRNGGIGKNWLICQIIFIL